MPDGVKSKSPLIRSLSSKDIRRKSGRVNGYLSPEKSSSKDASDSSEAEEHLLQDLDNILYRKLHVGESSPNGSMRVSPTSTSPPGPSDDHSEEEPETNALDQDAEEEEEENDFANVDEIDGPISPSSSSGSLKNLARSHTQNDNKENQSHDIDYNLPVDRKFQDQLNKRAQEIEQNGHVFQPSRAALQWSLKDFYSLQEELPDWFCSADYGLLEEAKSCFEKHYDPAQFLIDPNYATSVISSLSESLTKSAIELRYTLALAYISMGTFALKKDLPDHIDSIKRNNILLVPHLPSILKAFKRYAILCRDERTHLRHYTLLLFQASTILFFLINVLVDCQANDEHQEACVAAMDTFRQEGILEFLVKYIEHWRWNSRLSMRIRIVIILFHRLLLLQFGDMKQYGKAKKYVYKKHNISPKTGRPNALNISPLDYHAFREDITSRFPTFVPPPSDVPSGFDNSNSLSQFLEIPRAKSKSTLNSNLAPPEGHIATPVPTPCSSPTSQSRGSKSRKSFQTNLAYPSLYPSDSENGADELSGRINAPDDLDNETQVPFSVLEATKILRDSVQIKLSTQQLWHERELFMTQERGWNLPAEESKRYLYHYEDDDSDEAKRMVRVEEFYQECLPSLSSIVYVLLQTIESNHNNRAYTRESLEDEAAEVPMASQLEMIRSKEIVLKSSCSSLFLLAKWFKLSHILKFEQLCIVLHDYKLINIVTNMLNTFTDHYQERVFGKILQPQHSLWDSCSAFNPEYFVNLKGRPNLVNDASLNLRFLNTEVFLLKLLNMVTGDKTQRLKELPLSIGSLLKTFYQVFNLDIYQPILRITQELTPFKNKKWKSEHMDLISGVYLYRKLKLGDNWVTGKDITGELNDACGQEIALRALLQFYNFLHYKSAVEHFGYHDKSDSSFFSKEAELLTNAH